MDRARSRYADGDGVGWEIVSLVLVFHSLVAKYQRLKVLIRFSAYLRAFLFYILAFIRWR